MAHGAAGKRADWRLRIARLHATSGHGSGWATVGNLEGAMGGVNEGPACGSGVQPFCCGAPQARVGFHCARRCARGQIHGRSVQLRGQECGWPCMASRQASTVLSFHQRQLPAYALLH